MNKTILLFIITLVFAANASSKCNSDDCLLKCCTEQGTCGRFIAECKEFSECQTDSDCKSSLLKCSDSKCAPSTKLVQNPAVSVLEGALLDIIDSVDIAEANQVSNPTASSTESSKKLITNEKTKLALEQALLKLIAELDQTDESQLSESDKSALLAVGSMSLNAVEDDVKKAELPKVKSVAEKTDKKSNYQSSTKSSSQEIKSSALKSNKSTTDKKEAFPKYVRQNAKIFDDSDDLKLDEDEKRYSISEIYGKNKKSTENNKQGFVIGKHRLSNKEEEEIMTVLKGLLEKAYRDYDSESDAETVDSNMSDEDSDDDVVDFFSSEDEEDVVLFIIGYCVFWAMLLILIKLCRKHKQQTQAKAQENLQNSSVSGQTPTLCERCHTAPSLNQSIELPTHHHHNSNMQLQNGDYSAELNAPLAHRNNTYQVPPQQNLRAYGVQQGAQNYHKHPAHLSSEL